VLFSDLSGYTTISEKLDPEEVKEITSRIFGEISKVINKYGGFVEKFVGDAVMAIFGVPKVHEDDAVRAIRAAKEIHQTVEKLSPKLEEKVGRSLTMHTGINTGLVVTGDVDIERGTHGIIGETINLASRLEGLAAPGEILVGMDTYRHAEWHFDFEEKPPAKVQGISEPVKIFKVLSPKEQPIKVHRLHGLRSELIGRDAEIAELNGAVEDLKNNRGTIFSICGSAGTGKSRLVKEFKSELDLAQIQWSEGHAYPYAKNIPYFPVINMLARAFQIKESDTLEKIKQKIEFGITSLMPDQTGIIPFVGSLFNLDYPELKTVSPESWKSKLHEAFKILISALAKRGPTVICLEDLHWADPSSLEFARGIIKEFRDPILFLCIYRPTIDLFTSEQTMAAGDFYRQIELSDLSRSETENMVESLLKTKAIPSELRKFVNEKVDGNPFYLEEMINALIDSETLMTDNGGWRLTQAISAANISSSIHGVITARIDHLEKENKRVLQEASVIGRTFQGEILANITSLENGLDKSLDILERLDLIISVSDESDALYRFKHALIQEVVYNSLLRKERKAIHERIGLAMETLFRHRISEFYETLAYHFTQAKSRLKATGYLMEAGKKSLKKFAVEEADRYYRKALKQLASATGSEKDEAGILLDLLDEWALVYYYRGDFKGMERLLEDNLESADVLGDNVKSGKLYAWLGFAQFCREKNKKSYQVLQTALQLGQDADDPELISYACTWLTWTCAELGLYDKGIEYGQRAQKIVAEHGSAPHIYDQLLSGMGEVYFFRGDVKKPLEIGQQLVEYGRKNANSRSIVNGYITIGHGRMNAGDYATALQNYSKAYDNAKDPFYFEWPKFFMGMCYTLENRFEEAEQPLREVLAYSDEYGCEALGTSAKVFLAVLLISRGKLARGLKDLNKLASSAGSNGRYYPNSFIKHIQGTVYLRLLQRESSLNVWGLIRNLGFLMKTLPKAANKAEQHFKQSISIASRIGSTNLVGQASLDLGRLYHMKKKNQQSRELIERAITIFKNIGASVHLENAKNEQIELN
jgi:class 3 adenylate cyclase/tetratricopeptide (TPR) repeat protein